MKITITIIIFYTIDEIDTNQFVLTMYKVNDYVLRRYPHSKIRAGEPVKTQFLLAGRYQVTQVFQQGVADLVDKSRCTIHNLATDKEYTVEGTHIWPFYVDLAYVTPTLKVEVKDMDEIVVNMIV